VTIPTAEELNAMPVMQEWRRATKAVIDAGGVVFAIAFMRELADRLESEMVPLDDVDDQHD
jgi:hypothetical protein